MLGKLSARDLRRARSRWLVARESSPHGALHVYARDGTVTVPLTGDARLDAILTRIARRGGTVTEVLPDDPDAAMRDQLRND